MGLREDLAALTIEGTAAFAAATTQDALETARIAFLGTNGREKDLTQAFGALPGPEKREFGPLLNQAKTAVKEAFDAAKAACYENAV